MLSLFKKSHKQKLLAATVTGFLILSFQNCQKHEFSPGADTSGTLDLSSTIDTSGNAGTSGISNAVSKSGEYVQAFVGFQMTVDSVENMSIDKFYGLYNKPKDPSIVFRYYQLGESFSCPQSVMASYHANFLTDSTGTKSTGIIPSGDLAPANFYHSGISGIMTEYLDSNCTQPYLPKSQGSSDFSVQAHGYTSSGVVPKLFYIWGKTASGFSQADSQSSLIPIEMSTLCKRAPYNSAVYIKKASSSGVALRCDYLSSRCQRVANKLNNVTCQ